jgi:hypothetical protein
MTGKIYIYIYIYIYYYIMKYYRSFDTEISLQMEKPQN